MKIPHFIVKLFSQLGRSLVPRNLEPQIKSKRDRYGHFSWQVYDFKTNKSSAFGSEQEVRAWIDNHYRGF